MTQLRLTIASKVSQYRALFFQRLFGSSPQMIAAESQASPQQRPKRSIGWIHVFVSILFVLFYGFLLYQGYKTWDFSALQTIQFDISGILAASLMQMFGYIGIVYLWGRILLWLGYSVPFLQHLKIYAYSGLAVKLPGFFWGIATRVYLYSRYSVAKSAVGVASAIELLAISVASAALCLIITTLNPQIAIFLPSYTIILACIVCGVFTHPKVLRFALARVLSPALNQALAALPWGKMLLLIAGYMSIIALGGLCLFSIVSAFVGIKLELLATIAQTWALTVLWSSFLVWLPVDFGLGQGPFLVIFATIFPTPIVGVLWLAWRIWSNAIELIWGAIGFTIALVVERKARKKARDRNTAY